MFNVSVDEENYRVTFQYPRERVTKCNVWQDGSIVAIGLAICSKQDQFCKNNGRKVALGKLLQVLFPERQNLEVLAKRQLFWAKYFETRNGKF